MFRRRPAEQLAEAAKAQRHSERLQALGELIDERRFALDGICILASGDGYIVTGYALVTDSLETRLAQHTLEVTSEMLAAVITRRRVGR
jgi:hypothetical protein